MSLQKLTGILTIRHDPMLNNDNKKIEVTSTLKQKLKWKREIKMSFPETIAHTYS